MLHVTFMLTAFACLWRVAGDRLDIKYDMHSSGHLRCTHVLPNPPDAVWKALTDPRVHALWWAAGDVHPVVGHTFMLDMDFRWGMQKLEVAAVEQGRSLTYFFGAPALDTTLTFRLEPARSGTLLDVEHEGFDLRTPSGRAAFHGMASFWPAAIDRIPAAIAIATRSRSTPTT